MGTHDSPPTFSIISVIKNIERRRTFFCRCVESVLEQTFGDLELVIQDGGSTDNTLGIISEFDDPRIITQSEPDSVHAEGMFRAFKRCRGRYIGSCWSDEEMLPDALAKALEVFEENRQIAAFYGNYRLVDENGNRSGSIVPKHPFSITDYVCQIAVPPFCSSFFSRAFLEQMGIWDHHWRHDIAEFEFWIRLADAGPILYVPRDFSCFGRHPDSDTNTASLYGRLARERAAVMADLFEENRILRDSGVTVDRAIAGNYVWAARSVLRIEGPSEAFARLVEQAARHDSQAPGLTQLRESLPGERKAAPSPSTAPKAVSAKGPRSAVPDSPEALRQTILEECPGLTEKLRARDVHGAVDILRDWTSRIVPVCDVENKLSPADILTSYRAFQDCGGGAWCFGTAVFHAQVLDLFGIPATRFGCGYRPPSVLSHATTVFADLTSGSPRFYVSDAYFNLDYRDSSSGTPLELPALLRRIARGDYASIGTRLRPAVRPCVVQPGRAVADNWYFRGRTPGQPERRPDRWIYPDAHLTPASLLHHEPTWRREVDERRGDLEPEQFVLQLMLVNQTISPFDDENLTRQLAETLSAARKLSSVRADVARNPVARRSAESPVPRKPCGPPDTDRRAGEPFRTWIDSLARRQNRLYYRDQSSRTLSSLAKLARETDPSVVVELGTLAGLSLRTWVAATGRAKVFAVDLSFGRLHETRRILPLDLSRVTLVEQDILKTDLAGMWGPEDRVILFIDAHDLPGVPIMEHVLTSAVPALPDGSLVVVDDLWFSPERLTRENARTFLDRQVVPQIDELQCFEGHYAPYHRGGSFMGFAEVGPLLKFVNRHGIELRREEGAKHVHFMWRREYLSREHAPREPNAAEDATCWGSVTYNPLESVPASPALRGTTEKLAAAYRQGRVREVAEALSSLLRQHPRETAVAYGLAVCLARGGALTDARSVLERAAGEATHPRYRRLLTDIVRHLEPERPGAGEPAARSPQGASMTLFAMPKPFVGHAGIIQKNAIRSWAKLDPRPEILLFGEEPGIREMAQEVGARHIPEIERNEFGTPRVDRLFQAAQEHASHEVLAYVNADMILFPDFTAAAEKVRTRFPAFLLIGRRWDLSVTGEIDFADTAWRQAVCAEIRENGMLHAECGLDYFVFSKGLWPEIPPFAIGRTMWDNWLVGDPCKRGVPVIDGTEFVTAVHQDHDYGHLKGGRDEAWRGVEAERNRSLVKPSGNSGYTSGTPWVLRCDGTVASAPPRMPTFVTDPYRKQRAAWLLRQAWRLTEMGRKDLALARCEETIGHFEAWLISKINNGRRCGPMDTGQVVEQYTAGFLALAQLYVRLGRPERVVALYTRLLEHTHVRMPEAQRVQIAQLRDRMLRHFESVKASVPAPMGRNTAEERPAQSRRDGRNRPKVTVITACRNEEGHLEECLESILQQTMAEWELLLLDDGSTDGTRAIMERYAARDQRIQLFFFEDRRGPYVRRNDAIARSRTDFIVIHDADDIMCPNKLERLYEAITEDDRLAVVGSFYRAFLDGFHEVEHCEDVVLPTSHEEILDNYRTKGISAWCPHGMAIIRKRLFDEIGVYDTNPFGADSLWMVKLLEYAARTDAIRLAVVPEFLALRRMHMHSQTGMLPCFDPRSRRARYWEYCLDRLGEAFTRLNQNPAADVGAELRRVDCGDFVEKNGHLFAEWESEPLTDERIAGFWKRIVQHFVQERFVQCVLTCGIVEGLVEGIARTIRGYELVRGAAYFALGLSDRASECLQRELDAHGTSAARDLRDWCCAEGDLLDTRAKRISLIKTVLSPTDSPARPGAEPAGPSQDAPDAGLPDDALSELERRFRAMPDNHAAKQVLALRISEIAQRLRLPEKSQAWKREAALLAGGRAV